MNSINKIFLTISLSVFISYSHNSWAKTKNYIFEPYLGAELGSWSETQTITSSSDVTTYNLAGNSLGYFYGAKVLYLWRGMFLVGIDYQMGAGSQKYTNDEASTLDDSFQDVSASKSRGGIVLGIFRKQWSFKVSYFLLNNLVLEKGIVTGSSELTYSGSAISINFSYNIRPKINLNFEYITSSYDTIESNGSTGKLPGTFAGITYGDLSHTSLHIYASFPF